LRALSQAQRRAALEKAMERASASVHVTPCSKDRKVAGEWFHRFEGAAPDGAPPQHEPTPYQPGKRAMIKVKHARTADCVVAGFRWHKNGPGTLVGSLLLGLFDGQGRVHQGGGGG